MNSYLTDSLHPSLSPYIMQYFRVYIQRHEELTTQCCDEIWKCDHKKIKQKKCLWKFKVVCMMKWEGKSWDQQPSQVSNGFLRFISQFNVSIPCKKDFFYHQEKVFRSTLDEDAMTREKEAKESFFMFLFISLWGSIEKQLEKFS